VKFESIYDLKDYFKCLQTSSQFLKVFEYKKQKFYCFKLFKQYFLLYSPSKIDKKEIDLILKSAKLQKKHLVYTLSEESTSTENPQKKSFKEINPRATRIIKLDSDIETIFKQFHQKGRYNTRLAKKKGIVIKTSKDIKTFYKLWKLTAKRDQFYIHSFEFLKESFEKLSKQNASTLYLAFKDNSAIGGLLTLDSKNTRFYLYGASDDKYKSMMAPYLLQYTAIKDAVEKKQKFYDFLGIQNPLDKDKSLQGVTEFKRKFGGEILYFKKSQIIVNNWPIFVLLKLRKFLKNLRLLKMINK